MVSLPHGNGFPSVQTLKSYDTSWAMGASSSHFAEPSAAVESHLREGGQVEQGLYPHMGCPVRMLQIREVNEGTFGVVILALDTVTGEEVRNVFRSC